MKPVAEAQADREGKTMAGRRPKKGEEPKKAQANKPTGHQRRLYNAYVKKQFAGSVNPDVMDMKDWLKMNK